LRKALTKRLPASRAFGGFGSLSPDGGREWLTDFEEDEIRQAENGTVGGAAEA